MMPATFWAPVGLVGTLPGQDILDYGTELAAINTWRYTLGVPGKILPCSFLKLLKFYNGIKREFHKDKENKKHQQNFRSRKTQVTELREWQELI